MIPRKRPNSQENRTLTDTDDLIGRGDRSQKRKERENDFPVKNKTDH